MATLAAVQLEDLPVVVRFILHSATSADAYEVSNGPYCVFTRGEKNQKKNTYSSNG